MTTVTVHAGASGALNEIVFGSPAQAAGEPVTPGDASGVPSPYDYLLVALGACTSMTLALYAHRKKWPLAGVTVELRHSRIYAEDCADCETKEGRIDQIDTSISIAGSLSDEQRARLLEIAAKCPVHRTLTSEIVIRPRLVEARARSSSSRPALQRDLGPRPAEQDTGEGRGDPEGTSPATRRGSPR
jgi:putative redox protein